MPGVSGAALHDDITGTEVDFAFVELEVHLTGKNDAVVDRLGGVHAGIVFFHHTSGVEAGTGLGEQLGELLCLFRPLIPGQEGEDPNDRTVLTISQL